MSHLVALLVRDINTMGVDFREKQGSTHLLASIANEFLYLISFTWSTDSPREKDNSYTRKYRFGLSPSVGATQYTLEVSDVNYGCPIQY